VTFDDFLPFVAPSITACPRDTLLHHIQLAAIEFCAKSLVWTEDLPELLADGYSNEYVLALDDQVEVGKLLAVTLRDSSTARPEEAEIVTPADGQLALLRGSLRVVAWTDERRRVQLSPAPRLDARIAVRVVLKPALTSFSFPDTVFAHHAEDIAQGAIARLLRMPKCDWTDVLLAGDYEARFRDKWSAAAAMASRGFARTRRAPTERFF
jgi:hypothetical protein